VQRLDEVPGIGPKAAQVIIAELGLDMGQFPTPGHLVSWAKIAPQTIQSGAKHRTGPTGKGNPYLRGTLGEVAAAAAKTDTFLGERYRRLVRRRGKLKALVAIARSILVIVWHLLADPTARFRDLGADYHTSRIDTGRKTRSLSANSRPSATPSPCNPPHSPRPAPRRPHADPIPPPPTTRLRCAPPGAAACPLRWSFSGQKSVPDRPSRRARCCSQCSGRVGRPADTVQSCAVARGGMTSGMTSHSGPARKFVRGPARTSGLSSCRAWVVLRAARRRDPQRLGTRPSALLAASKPAAGPGRAT